MTKLDLVDLDPHLFSKNNKVNVSQMDKEQLRLFYNRNKFKFRSQKPKERIIADCDQDHLSKKFTPFLKQLID